MTLAQKASSKLYTYGYKKASIMASLINSTILIAIVVHIFKEAIERFNNPPEIIGNTIILTALIGLVINAASAFLFSKGQKQDINIKGAFLHLLVDALVSIGVVISGIIIHYTKLSVVDPIISVIIAVVIFVSTWGLLKESVKLALDGVPQNVNIDEINEVFKNNRYIDQFKHVHIWALSSTENALTVHIKLKKDNKIDSFKAKQVIRNELKQYNIQHITIELEKDFSQDNEC